MMAGAEGLRRLDVDIDGAMRHRRIDMPAMDIESPPAVTAGKPVE